MRLRLFSVKRRWTPYAQSSFSLSRNRAMVTLHHWSFGQLRLGDTVSRQLGAYLTMLRSSVYYRRLPHPHSIKTAIEILMCWGARRDLYDRIESPGSLACHPVHSLLESRLHRGLGTSLAPHLVSIRNIGATLFHHLHSSHQSRYLSFLLKTWSTANC